MHIQSKHEHKTFQKQNNIILTPLQKVRVGEIHMLRAALQTLLIPMVLTELKRILL